VFVVNQHSWRSRLYSSYVTSGQAKVDPSQKQTMFADRRRYIEPVIHRHFALDKDTPILDLGCGHGAFVHVLRLNGFTSVTGVDVSEEQVALAHQLGIDGITQGELLGYLQRTESESVGVTLLWDIVEHLTRDEAFVVLDEVFRVLRPGGKCLIHVPNAEGIFGMRVRYGDLTHEQSFTPTSAKQLLNTIGFSKITAHEDKPVPHGFMSIGRRLVWEAGTFPYRLLLAAETSDTHFVLSQNMLVVAHKR
jgi:2-polyprenyl-3-methyl-5-hydroxy-6-metoxy-1,4-benzoquinol methylase